jgi:hypothetical protein
VKLKKKKRNIFEIKILATVLTHEALRLCLSLQSDRVGTFEIYTNHFLVLITTAVHLTSSDNCFLSPENLYFTLPDCHTETNIDSSKILLSFAVIISGQLLGRRLLVLFASRLVLIVLLQVTKNLLKSLL